MFFQQAEYYSFYTFFQFIFLRRLKFKLLLGLGPSLKEERSKPPNHKTILKNKAFESEKRSGTSPILMGYQTMDQAPITNVEPAVKSG